jgi:hypothetical protein
LYSVLIKLVPTQIKLPYLPQFRAISKRNIEICDFKAESSQLKFELLFGQDLVMQNSEWLSVLEETITLLTQYCKLYSDSTSILEVFEPFSSILFEIPKGNSTLKVVKINSRRLLKMRKKL